MHYINFVLLSVAWAGLAYLFLIAKSYIFGNFKRLFHTKRENNKPQAEGSNAGTSLTSLQAK